jgi:hypothetical protein
VAPESFEEFNMPNPPAQPRPATRSPALLGQCLLLGALSLFVLGLSTRAEDEIPDTDLVVSAEIVDVSQTTTVGERISVDGATYFSVLRGKMTVFVPFDKLKGVEASGEVKSDDGVDRVEASFTFQDGSTEKGLLKARQIVYGVSKLGNFQLKIRDLRSIRFLSAKRKESTPKPSTTAPHN